MILEKYITFWYIFVTDSFLQGQSLNMYACIDAEAAISLPRSKGSEVEACLMALEDAESSHIEAAQTF